MPLSHANTYTELPCSKNPNVTVDCLIDAIMRSQAGHLEVSPSVALHAAPSATPHSGEGVESHASAQMEPVVALALKLLPLSALNYALLPIGCTRNDVVAATCLYLRAQNRWLVCCERLRPSLRFRLYVGRYRQLWARL